MSALTKDNNESVILDFSVLQEVLVLTLTIKREYFLMSVDIMKISKISKIICEKTSKAHEIIDSMGFPNFVSLVQFRCRVKACA